MDLINFIQQEDSTGCGLACIAMMYKDSYKRIKERYYPEFDDTGLTVGEVVRMMEAESGDKILTANRLLIGQEGILFVPSLNVEGSGHFIYYSPKCEIFDPLYGTEGKKIYTHNNLWVINHLCVATNLKPKTYIKKQIQYLVDLL